jgi:peptide/nickel transport system permease protein/oligopeptide transport system permease protein
MDSVFTIGRNILSGILSVSPFIIKRLLIGVVVIWAIVTIVFVLEHAPGAADPVRLALGSHYTYGAYKQLQHEYGLDQSLWNLYLQYLGFGPILAAIGIHVGTGTVSTGLLEGNLGLSYQYVGTPVWSLLQPRLPVTLKLGFYALIVSLIVGLPIGMISALRQNSMLDHVGQGTMIILYAIPTFVLVPLLQLEFSINLGWFPVQGWGDNWKEVVLPVVAYSAGLAGYFAKSYRSFMLEVLAQDYIRTARAKGLKQQVIVGLHAAKNTLVPLASIVGPTIAYLIVGAFIIERFFAIPGIASETIESTLNGDYAFIEATTILLVGFVIVVNMLTDIFYAIVDPRVRI